MFDTCFIAAAVATYAADEWQPVSAATLAVAVVRDLGGPGQEWDGTCDSNLTYDMSNLY